MRISRKALRARIELQTNRIKSAYRKYKQGAYSKKEYDLEMERLDNDFENFFESGGKA